MSKRLDILDRIKYNFDTLDELEETSINKVSPVDLEIMALPAAFIYSDAEVKVTDERAIIGMETWDWTVVIELWSKDYNNLDDVLKAVHTILNTDRRLNGLVEDMERLSLQEIVIDPTKEIRSMLLTYNILYRHTLGDIT